MARKAATKRRAADARQRERLKHALSVITTGSSVKPSPALNAAAAEACAGARAWLGHESVQGIGIGRRTVKGKETGALVLKVYVDRKLPLAKLAEPAPKRLRIPGLRSEVEIDIEEVGRVSKEHAIGPWPGDQGKWPAAPGDAIGLADAAEGTGTLGCLVRRRNEPDALYLLSNAHVICRDGTAAVGTPVLRPSGERGGRLPGNLIAKYTDWIPISHSPSDYANVADAAIARIDKPQQFTAAIREIGYPNGVNHIVREGDKVCIAGSRSGYSEGVVKDVNFLHVDEYRLPGGGSARAGFREQVLCSSYSQKGDSGAAVLNAQHEIVGLHFAGSSDGANPCSIFTPIGRILAALDIDIVQRDIAPAAAPAAARAAQPFVTALLPSLNFSHNYQGGVSWLLGENGVTVDGRIETTRGPAKSVARVWDAYGISILRWAEHFEVPVELIIATICTESSGKPDAFRHEPGYTSDEATPHRVSIGLMQTLISTARSTLGNATIDRQWLAVPDHSIQAGVAYIDDQRRATQLDPPKVACAYNAGGLYKNLGAGNRWRMRQFPIGTAEHANRFIEFFNDCFRMFKERGDAPAVSFCSALRR